MRVLFSLKLTNTTMLSEPLLFSIQLCTNIFIKIQYNKIHAKSKLEHATTVLKFIKNIFVHTKYFISIRIYNTVLCFQEKQTPFK